MSISSLEPEEPKNGGKSSSKGTETKADAARRRQKRMKISEQRDFINEMPKEVLTEIFSLLPTAEDRCVCTSVCKKWCLTIGAMRRSEFKHKVPVMKIFLTRNLRAKNFSDLRACAVSSGMNAFCIVSKISIDGTSKTDKPQVTDDKLELVTQNCSALNSLFLENCPLITGVGLRSVTQNCNQLTKVELKSLKTIDDDGVCCVAENCPQLSYLGLINCPNLTDGSLETVAARSPGIKHLAVRSCRQITRLGITNFVSIRPSLLSLDIEGMPLRNETLNYIATHCTELQSLNLGGILGLSTSALTALGLARSLNHISIRYSFLSQDPVGQILVPPTLFDSLTTLSFFSSPSLTDELLIHITKYAENLQSLQLTNCIGFSYTGLVVALTYSSSSLRSLSLIGCFLSGDEELIARPPFFPRPLLRLNRIKIERCSGIGDKFLSFIGEYCRWVKELSFGEMATLTNRGVRDMMNKMRGGNRVKKVSFTSCENIGNPSVWAVTRVCKEKLCGLVLKGCRKVTDCGASVISKRCKCIEELDLGGCNVSDKTVLQIANDDPIELQSICLAGCAELTDVGATALLSVGPSLDRVDVRGCNLLSRGMIAQLRLCFSEVIR